MRYWWVNQNQTYRFEVPGGYLWSPKTRSDGRSNHFYDTMAQAQLGDLIFSFADTRIKALGTVSAPVATAPKPTEFGTAGAAWADEGWFLEVAFSELADPIRPKDHIETLRPFLPAKYSPLQPDGNGNQGVYLTELSTALATALGELIGPEFDRLLRATPDSTGALEDDAAQAAIQSRSDISETYKLQLVKARRGQGLFRSRVELVETNWRVTGISERQHLRASHIMPWRVADDRQKLDGNNGLMLAPHVDHLFDLGYITFDADGALVTSDEMSQSVVEAWSISLITGPRAFSPEQAVYLDYHRKEIFRH